MFGSGAGFPSIGRVTKFLLALYVGASVINAVLPFRHVIELVPVTVLHGEVWRVVTYPWLAGDALSLVINVLVMIMFAGPLEMMWGSRRYLWRVALFVIVPAIATVLLSLVVPALRDGRMKIYGLQALMYGLVAAFSAERRHERFMLFPLPFEVSGDGLLLFDGAYLALSVLFSFTQVGVWPYVVSILSFVMALLWFRIDVTRDVRRVWLKLRRKQLEGRMARLRAQRNLRIVSSDDDDEQPRRYLH